MKKYFKFHASLGWQNDDRYEIQELEFKDDATEQDIGQFVTQHYEEWLSNTMDSGWWEVDKNGNDL